jgi:hypothetical protein
MVEIDTQIGLLRRQIGDLEAQQFAFETVIRFYDPSFALTAPSK